MCLPSSPSSSMPLPCSSSCVQWKIISLIGHVTVWCVYVVILSPYMVDLTIHEYISMDTKTLVGLCSRQTFQIESKTVYMEGSCPDHCAWPPSSFGCRWWPRMFLGQRNKLLCMCRSTTTTTAIAQAIELTPVPWSVNNDAPHCQLPNLSYISVSSSNQTMSKIATSIHKLPGQGVNVWVTHRINSAFTRIQYPWKTCWHPCRYSLDLSAAGKDYPTLEIVHNSQILVPGIQSSIIWHDCGNIWGFNPPPHLCRCLAQRVLSWCSTSPIHQM